MTQLFKRTSGSVLHEFISKICYLSTREYQLYPFLPFRNSSLKKKKNSYEKKAKTFHVWNWEILSANIYHKGSASAILLTESQGRDGQ